MNVQPSATESPPLKRPPDPGEKKVVLKKPAVGKWEMKVSGPVTKKDINHLYKLIRIEYNRILRRKRVELNRINQLAHQEQKNGTAV